MRTITLPDGRIFPTIDGTPLSWSIGLYHTHAEEQAGFPKMRAVIRAMRVMRPEALEQERREMIKASFHSGFGHNARKCLDVIEAEMASAT